MAAKSKNRLYIFGTPIAWIAVYGALVGVTSLVPILPYAGGGGYWPLATVIAALGALILGPIGGAVAAFIGGIIGMFIAPPAFPLGIVDAIAVVMIPEIFVALAFNVKKYRWAFLGWQALMTAIFFIVLFVYPGVVGGWPPIPTANYFLATLYYWLLPTLVLASPLGSKYVYEWSRSSDVKQRSIGVFLGSWMAMNCVVHFAIILVVLDSLRVPISTTVPDGVGDLHLVHATLRTGTFADRSSHHRGS